MKAATANASSIGLPAVGMGVKNYPSKEVFQCITQAVKEFSQAHPASQLTDIKIYLYKRALSAAQLKVNK